jgi:hypothetical protein
MAVTGLGIGLEEHLAAAVIKVKSNAGVSSVQELSRVWRRIKSRAFDISALRHSKLLSITPWQLGE